MTAYERSGWRDKEISQRHRSWGFNCPAVDLDFLMVEYNLGCPVAVVEYKHHLSTETNFKHPTYRALGQLYDERGKQLPLLVAKYWPDIWAFKHLPLNISAAEWLPSDDWTPWCHSYIAKNQLLRAAIAYVADIIGAVGDKSLGWMAPPNSWDGNRFWAIDWKRFHDAGHWMWTWESGTWTAPMTNAPIQGKLF